MRTTIGFLLVTLSAAGTASARQTTPTPPPDKHAVVFSATGGTSKGSYQGGNDWVISEFLRRQRGNAEFRRRAGLPTEWDLKAVTGASAGNVNALVTGIGWCTEAPDRTRPAEVAIAAEDSLFWKFWVGTGIDQLISPDDKPNGETGVFDRTFFINDLRAELDRFVKGSVARESCSIPVGITMTKQTPVELMLTQSGRVTRVQRFAAVFELTTQTGALTVERPSDSLAKAGGLGALALPPGPADCSQEEHGLNWAFNVMIASSSFPVAFAPRRVCYRSGGLVADGVQRALFADGGVFDNNPAGLGLGLADYRSELKGQNLKALDVFYTMGSNERGALRTARASAVPRQDLLGLSGTKQLLSGALTAAQEYEVQTLMRQTSRDHYLMLVGRKVEFFPSSRSGEILGETLAGFGAFLAREFRQYDFYAGIYDGLDFIARYVCDRSAPTPCDPSARVTTWIDENLLDLSEPALLVVKWRQALEQSPGVPMRLDDWRHQLGKPDRSMLFAIHNQISTLARNREEISSRTCNTRNDIVGNYLCVGGLDTLLTGLKNDPMVSALRKTPGNGIDPALEELLKRPETRVNSIIEKALNRLHAAEESLQGTQPEMNSWVEAALLFYRGQSYRYRKGLKVNPSSGQGDLTDGFASIVNIVTPNYVTLGLIGPSQSRPQYTLGWRPLVIRPWQGLYIGSVFEFSNLEDRRLQWKDNALGATIGSYALKFPLISSAELGYVQTRFRLKGGDHLASASFRFLADKFHFNVRWKPRGDDEWFVNLGISDVNGLLYWLIR